MAGAKVTSTYRGTLTSTTGDDASWALTRDASSVTCAPATVMTLRTSGAALPVATCPILMNSPACSVLLPLIVIDVAPAWIAFESVAPVNPFMTAVAVPVSSRAPFATAASIVWPSLTGPFRACDGATTLNVATPAALGPAESLHLPAGKVSLTAPTTNVPER